VPPVGGGSVGSPSAEIRYPDAPSTNTSSFSRTGTTLTRLGFVFFIGVSLESRDSISAQSRFQYAGVRGGCWHQEKRRSRTLWGGGPVSALQSFGMRVFGRPGWCPPLVYIAQARYVKAQPGGGEWRAGRGSAKAPLFSGTYELRLRRPRRSQGRVAIRAVGRGKRRQCHGSDRCGAMGGGSSDGWAAGKLGCASWRTGGRLFRPQAPGRTPRPYRLEGCDRRRGSDRARVGAVRRSLRSRSAGRDGRRPRELYRRWSEYVPARSCIGGARRLAGEGGGPCRARSDARSKR
jgi:hypothetical protein